MTIEEYFEALKESRKCRTPFGLDTAKEFEQHFKFIEEFIKNEELTVEEYLFMCNNFEKFRKIKTIYGVQFYEQWKKQQNNTKKD